MMTASPYSNLPPESFWKTGVSQQRPKFIEGLYKKRFAISPTDPIATAGSCFAQHIAKHLRSHSYTVIDVEPAPPGVSAETAIKWGYGIYSARYGNIYVVRQLLQLAREAFGEFTPTNAIWEKDGRFYDALRPSVEPRGLESAEAVALHRHAHLRHVAKIFKRAKVLIFTLGLTESWIHQEAGTVYPTAPGTIAGSYDSTIYAFKNFTHSEILDDFLTLRSFLQERNPELKFLLTVSPVPLTATASGHHVLAATTYSKSVLRAVAGELYERFDDVDYFPSYELITSPLSRGKFYEPNLRSVTSEGVEAVMRAFFRSHEAPGERPPEPAAAQRRRRLHPESQQRQKDKVVCEDILLETFAR